MTFYYLKVIDIEENIIYYENYFTKEINLLDILKNININEKNILHYNKLLDRVINLNFSKKELYEIIENDEESDIYIIIYYKMIDNENNLYLIKKQNYVEKESVNYTISIIPHFIKLLNLNNMIGEELLKLLDDQLDKNTKEFLNQNKTNIYPHLINRFDEIKYDNMGSGYTQNSIYMMDDIIAIKYREYCTYHGEEGEYEDFKYIIISKIEIN